MEEYQGQTGGKQLYSLSLGLFLPSLKIILRSFTLLPLHFLPQMPGLSQVVCDLALHLLNGSPTFEGEV